MKERLKPFLKAKYYQEALLIFLLFLYIFILFGQFDPFFESFFGDDEAESGYYIENYHTAAVVHEDATLDVTVELDVNFQEKHHGIYYSFPDNVTIPRQLENGKTVNWYYTPQITDLHAEGTPWHIDDESDDLYLGDAHKKVIGDQHYTILYHYTCGDDLFSGGDELFYSFVGTGWDCEIRSASFDVTFDKGCDLSAAECYLGREGSTDQSGVDLTVTENRIQGRSNRPLAPKEALTVRVPLPEGYYVNAAEDVGEFLPILRVSMAALGVLLAVAAVRLWLHNFSKKRPTQVTPTSRVPGTSLSTRPEFYPKDTLTSADVGYLLDNSPDTDDFLSLVTWFACQGFLTVEEDDSGKQRFRLGPRLLPNAAPRHIRVIFDALLDNDDTGAVLSKAIDTAGNTIDDWYGKERRLVRPMAVWVTRILEVLVCGGLLFAVEGCNYNANINLITILAVLLLVWVACFFNEDLFQPSSVIEPVRLVINHALLVLMLAAEMVYTMTQSNPMTWKYLILAHLFTLLALLALSWTSTATDYRTAMAAQLKGLRRFIASATEEELRRELAERPELFYELLPFAQVFELGEEWCARFEGLPVSAAPDEVPLAHAYTTHAFATSYYLRWRARQAVCAASVSSYGSSSGGAGGGFGGGGGGAW